jgi:hypothetical protein
MLFLQEIRKNFAPVVLLVIVGAIAITLLDANGKAVLNTLPR